MKKRALSVVSLLMAILMLTGCGSKSGETGGGTTTPEEEPSKTVSIAISENCITLDPHNANNQGSLIVSDCVYEPLIQTDNEGGYYPWLAESWEYDETGTVWTFHLRDGVKFNNGEPLTSADVVCSYQRLIDEYDSLCRAVELFPDHLLQSVEAPDEGTVVITLARPYSVALFSFAKTMIIPKSVYEEQGADMFYQQNLVATGPWKLEKWVDGQYAHYTKNADYWNPNYDSYYEELYVRHVLENSTAVAGHLSGDLDANLTTGGINPDMLALYSGSESRIEIVPVEVFSYYYMGFQCGEGSPFADINVRKAFECAIDRQTILDSIMGGGVVCKSVIPKGVLGYDENLPDYTYDPEMAKEYLAKSNYNGEEIVLSSNTSTAKAEEQLLAISGMLNEVGFNTTVSIVENATLLDMRKSGDYDVFMVITMHGGGDPGSIMNMRIVQDAHTSEFQDEELNNYILEGLRTIDADERAEYYKKAAERLREVSAPHTALYAPYANYAIDYGVVGLDLYKDGMLDVTFVDYDPDATTFHGPDYEALSTF